MKTSQEWAVFNTLYEPVSPLLANEEEAYAWISRHKDEHVSKGGGRLQVKPLESPDYVSEDRRVDLKQLVECAKWLNTRFVHNHANVSPCEVLISAHSYLAVTVLRAKDRFPFFYVMGDMPEAVSRDRFRLFHINGNHAPEYALWGHMESVGRDFKLFGGYFVLGEWDVKKGKPVPKANAHLNTRYNVYIKDI